MVVSDEYVQSAWAQVENVYQRRADLIPNLVETVKGYAKHEAETLENVIKWRNGIPANATMEEKNEFAASMSKVVSGLNVVMEQYPNLKADVQFVSLQNSIKDVEEQLQAARRIYNNEVDSKYINTKDTVIYKKSNILFNRNLKTTLVCPFL